MSYLTTFIFHNFFLAWEEFASSNFIRFFSLYFLQYISLIKVICYPEIRPSNLLMANVCEIKWKSSFVRSFWVGFESYCTGQNYLKKKCWLPQVLFYNTIFCFSLQGNNILSFDPTNDISLKNKNLIILFP